MTNGKASFPGTQKCSALMSRGQMEIMGLAIVVILITLGVLFALTSMRTQDTELREQYEQANLAHGFLKTFIKTNVPCGNDIMRQIIKSCVENTGLYCDPSLDPRGEGRELEACEYVNETLGVILENTLDIRRTKYHFFGTGPNMGEISAGSACPGERVVGGPQPIATDRGTVMIELHICG